MTLRELKITEESWSGMTPPERAEMHRLLQLLMIPERHELETGKLLVEARNIAEKYREFLQFLNTLPFTVRTAYRRIKMYERAVEMWPAEMIVRAIERRSPMLGVTNEKPMGLYEDLAPPDLDETAQYLADLDDLPISRSPYIAIEEKIENYLAWAELQVRRGAKGAKKKLSPRYLLKNSFKAMELATRHLPDGQQETFLDDLVGLAMTLFVGTNASRTFSPARIPEDFWTLPVGRYVRSPEVRGRFSDAAKQRYEREKTNEATMNDVAETTEKAVMSYANLDPCKPGEGVRVSEATSNDVAEKMKKAGLSSKGNYYEYNGKTDTQADLKSKRKQGKKG
jgi:hypothetical protein